MDPVAFAVGGFSDEFVEMGVVHGYTSIWLLLTSLPSSSYLNSFGRD